MVGIDLFFFIHLPLHLFPHFFLRLPHFPLLLQLSLKFVSTKYTLLILRNELKPNNSFCSFLSESEWRWLPLSLLRCHTPTPTFNLLVQSPGSEVTPQSFSRLQCTWPCANYHKSPTLQFYLMFSLIVKLFLYCVLSVLNLCKQG